MPPTICITPNCGKETKYKGICPSCYGVALKLINAGKTTWDQLDDLGLIKLDKKPFEIAFNEKIASIQQAPPDGDN